MQVSAVTGTWMELVENHPFDTPFPPGDPQSFFNDLSWGSGEIPPSSFLDTTFLEEDPSSCDYCNEPAPPVFSIPPPPPPPPPTLPPTTTKLPPQQQTTNNKQVGAKKVFLPHREDSVPKLKECVEVPSPEETCPALMVAGDAHARQRLQPPVYALVVGAATLALVAIIAALVCWR